MFSPIWGEKRKIWKNCFDTLYRHVKKVINILRRINSEGIWQIPTEKGYVVARCENMGICQRYSDFLQKGLIFPALCRLVRKFNFWSFLKEQGNFDT